MYVLTGKDRWQLRKSAGLIDRLVMHPQVEESEVRDGLKVSAGLMQFMAKGEWVVVDSDREGTGEEAFGGKGKGVAR